MTREEKDKRIKEIVGRLGIYPTYTKFCGPNSPVHCIADTINENSSKLQHISSRVNDLSELMIVLSTKPEDDKKVNTNNSYSELQEIVERNFYELQETITKVDDLYKIVSELSSRTEEDSK